jgi:hypothetical protein
MKAQSIRISVGIIALGALLYFLACSPPAPNSNSSQNQGVSQNQNQAGGNMSSMDMKPCDDYGPGHGAHAKAIKDEIKNKMSSSLKKLLKDQDNPGGTFTLEVQKSTNGKYYVGYIKGKISGDDNLKELSDILNDFQSKQDCLRVIFFQPPTTSAVTDDGPGFEWSSCEYPMVVCPNGECCMAVDTNANTNTGSSNSNTNSNVNRP